MSERPSLKLLDPGEGRATPLGKVGLSFKIGAGDGAGYCVAEMTLPPASANPLHGHLPEETMYVIEGELEIVGDHGQRRRLGPGSVVHVPSRAVHGFVNVGPGRARVLMITAPAQEAYFRDLSAAMSAGAADPQAIPAVRARHGIESLGPVGGR
jgi:quercetin dioxygenase-like cupin family protein